MLFLHEVHRVAGAKEREFEAAFRAGWMEALAADGGARLLWFLHHAHGTGPSYQVVTITALADGAAWEHLAARVQRGDLREWAREVDSCRHDVQARLLMALDFSPLDVDLATVPTDGRRHDPALYMEDTIWPKRGKAEEYIAAAGAVYTRMLGSDPARDAERRRGPGPERPGAKRREREARRRSPSGPPPKAARTESPSLISIEAAYQTMPGAGRYPEVTLMQKVHDMSGLVRLLTTDMPEAMARPGNWMHDALEFRDQWRSKLLRTASWSPLN
jgi:hypothetical protein